MILFGLYNSTIFINKIPQVQRLALIESIHYNSLQKHENTDKEILEIFLYNIQTSPHLSNTDFHDAVAESMQLIPSSYIDNEAVIAIEQMIRDEHWDSLISFTSNFTSHQALDSKSNDDQRLKGFQKMLLSIISTSKVLAKMKQRKRKRLEKSIQRAKTVEDILEIATIFVSTSKLFKEETDRKKIKDLIAVGRFDLLLLPACFDCDDKERLQEQNLNGSIENHCDKERIDEEEYCVICFEDMKDSSVTTTLECKHRFCTSCIQRWMVNHSTCPTCRGRISGTTLRQNHRRAETRPTNSDVNNLSFYVDGLINRVRSAVSVVIDGLIMFIAAVIFLTLEWFPWIAISILFMLIKKIAGLG